MTYVGAVRAALAGTGDPERAAQQRAYMKSELPYVGLGSPALKALLRPLLVEHRFVDRAQWEAAVLELWEDAEHREEWYAALALVRHRAYRQWLDPDTMPLLEHLVRTGAWWDVVDETATHPVGQVLLDHRDVVTPVMDAWSVDADSLWIRRTAMIAQLNHQERTDTDLLERVLVNLALNALRHSPGDAAVRLTAGRVGEHVELRIVDRGPGVDDSEKERVFAPFQRLDDRSSSGYGAGVGLGLAVARGFVEAMGGTLEAEDTPGGGLTMVVSLPVGALPVGALPVGAT